MITHSGKRLRENWKFVAAVSVIGIILLTGGYLFLRSNFVSIKQEKHEEISAVANLKIEELKQWQKERFADAQILAQAPQLLINIKQLLKNSKNSSAQKYISDQINAVKINTGYENIFVTTPANVTLLSVTKDSVFIEPIVSAKIVEATQTRLITSTDLYFCPSHKKIHYDIIAPVINEKNNVLAHIVFRINPDDYLYPLIQSWPSPNKTAETLIGKRSGDSVVFLNELRHRKNTALTLTVPLSSTGIPVVQAALGRRGVYEGKDYRGNEVLAYLAAVPNTQWVMVAKIDNREIFADFYYTAIATVALIFISILLFAFVLGWYYHSRQNNIFRALLLKEKEMRKYHQEFRTILYSIGDGVITTDTEGRVKQMNNTAEMLTGWTESESSGKPLPEVFNIINQYTRQKADNPVIKVLENDVIVGLANHTLLIKKDGTEIPIADSGAPIRNEYGKIDGTVLVFRDKSEEHKAEQLIFLNEARLKRAELVAKAGNWELHINEGTMTASEGASEIYGLQGSKWEIGRVQKMVLPVYREMLDKALKALITNNAPYNLEFKIKRADNNEIVDIHSIAEYDNENKVVFGIIQDITTRKKTEEALINREFWLNESQRVGKLGSYSFNVTTGIWASSPGLDIIFGIKDSDEKTLMSWNKLIHPEHREEMISYFHDYVLGQKQVFNKEYKIIRPCDGAIRWVWGQGELRFDSTNNPIEMFGTIQDITDKKKYEEQLQLAQFSIEHSPDSIFWVKRDGTFDYVNETAYQSLGYTRDELMQLSTLDIDITYSDASWANHFANLRKLGNAVFTSRHKKKDGSLIDVEKTCSIIRFDNREINCAIIRDITARVKIEVALRESEKRFRTMADTAPALIWMSGTDKQCTYFNKPWLDYTGRSLEQELGNGWVEGVHPHDVETCVDLYFSAFEARESFQMEYRLRRFDGSFHWVLDKGTPRFSDDGSFLGYIGSCFDISSLKSTEEALRKSEENFKEIFENAPVGYHEIDTQGRIIKINKTELEIMGYESTDMLHAFIWEFSENPSASRQRTLAKLSGDIQPDFNIERKSRKRDGSIITLLVGEILLLNELNQITGIRTAYQDITGRKMVEEALRASYEFNRSILQTIPFGMDIVGTDGNVLFMSDNLKEKFGNNVIGKKCWAMYKDDKVQCLDCPLKKEIKIGETSLSETNNILNGRSFLISHTGTWFEGKKAILEIFQDITERKQAEDKVKTLINAIEQNPVSIIITDPDGKIEYVNPKFCETTGYSTEEALNKNPRILSSGEKSPQSYKKMWDQILSGQTWTGEFHNKKKNGELFWENAVISPITNELNQITHFVSVKEDITGKKEMLKNLIIAKDKAEEMSRLKSSFLANMSHELRTPMIGILGFSELLRDNSDDPKTKTAAEIIANSGKRLMNTLNLILDLSRIEAGKLTMDSQYINVKQIITQICALFEPVANKKNLTLNVICEVVNLVLFLDEKMFSEIINNLVNNAIKFTSTGGVTVHITQETAHELPWAVIRIKDTGIGIAPEYQELIFEEFRQVSEGIGRNYEGSGLGLSITKKFVEKMGGYITVESEVKVGTVFSVRFPIPALDTNVPDLRAVPVPEKPTKMQTDPLPRLLYVEDDPVAFMVVELMLQGLFTVEHAHNSEQAIKKVNEAVFDAILMDINLVLGEDGLQTTKRIRQMETYKLTPIVAITAFAMVGDREEFLCAGCTHYLSKPFEKEQLVQLLAEIFA